jgi:hypothetical protein
MEMQDRHYYTGFVNGQGHEIKGRAAKWKLADWLVEKLDEIAEGGYLEQSEHRNPSLLNQLIESDQSELRHPSLLQAGGQKQPPTDQLKIYRHDDGGTIPEANEFFEFIETDQEWMTLEDYCLERELPLDHRQLIKEGKAISRYHHSHGAPGPHKLPHDRYGTINGYRRCSLDRWYEEFIARQ